MDVVEDLVEIIWPSLPYDFSTHRSCWTVVHCVWTWCFRWALTNRYFHFFVKMRLLILWRIINKAKFVLFKSSSSIEDWTLVHIYLMGCISCIFVSSIVIRISRFMIRILQFGNLPICIIRWILNNFVSCYTWMNLCNSILSIR